jgi:hypothetical protein
MTRPFGDSTTIPSAFADLSGIAGIPTQLGLVTQLTQAANINATTIATPTTGGLFRISAQIVRSQIATTSSTLPSVTITWTDATNSAAGSNTIIATNATNTLVASPTVELLLVAKANTAISYSTTGYASSGATPMQYALRIKLEAL